MGATLDFALTNDVLLPLQRKATVELVSAKMCNLSGCSEIPEYRFGTCKHLVFWGFCAISSHCCLSPYEIALGSYVMLP